MGEAAAVVFCLMLASPAYVVSACLMLPIVVDGGLQEVLHVESTNKRRLVTGLLGGFGFASLLIKLAGDLVALAMMFVQRIAPA